MEDRRNPFCCYGWGGLLALIIGGFTLGYGFSRKNFSAHSKGLIIAGGVAIGVLFLGIITCIVASWRRKRQAAFDEEDLVSSAPMRRQPSHEPPMVANPHNLHGGTGTDSQRLANQQSDSQQNGVDGLPEKPPPAYSEYPDDRVYRDQNPTSLLNV
ncbi:hypothetical protein INS49_006286 [Diaporthe citri]|uniref:uncharacterized protein n=1 Tax=Diaporthe citri TaxID=83186 RepID=UPI001C7F69F9|nr:uncharacterized protein INS49_006286 [Diaporthe citri]KAG6364682.1 hypothetical protein INS49_006286 [Diaporthe citri]